MKYQEAANAEELVSYLNLENLNVRCAQVIDILAGDYVVQVG
jgi:hypothetical protein